MPKISSHFQQIFQLYRRFDVFSFYDTISIVKIDVQRRVNLAEHFMIILRVLHICIEGEY